jgi:hypothetical protein
METTADAIAFSANTARLGLGGETLSRTFSSETRLNTVAGKYKFWKNGKVRASNCEFFFF